MRRSEASELRILAADFGLSRRSDVKDIIASCKCYSDGWRAIMAVYDKVYSKSR